MKKQVAEEICNLVEEILSRMQVCNNYVIASCEQPQLKRIVTALARCVTELDIELLEPIHREFPELKPSFLP
jgi:hypothetical protein